MSLHANLFMGGGSANLTSGQFLCQTINILTWGAQCKAIQIELISNVPLTHLKK